MKKPSPYMLVRKVAPDATSDPADTPTPPPRSGAKEKTAPKKPKASTSKDPQRLADRILRGSPELARTFEALEPAFRKTLLDAYVDSPPAARKKAARKSASRAPTPMARSGEGSDVSRKPRTSAAPDEYLAQITHDLGRTEKVERVGLLDLGAWIAGLPELLVRLNAAQDLYTLFEINAPVPAGLLKTREGMLAWTHSHDIKLTKAQAAHLAPHVIADDFFHVAADIRSGMGLDMVVGLVPVMVAGDAGGELYWNHFCSVCEGIALVSTADLRDYAAKAGRPFEAAVGVLLVGAILVRFNRKLQYHANRGCVFDYNEDRTGLIEAIRTPQICGPCTALMDAAQKAAAEAMLGVLRRMKRKST